MMFLKPLQVDNIRKYRKITHTFYVALSDKRAFVKKILCRKITNSVSSLKDKTTHKITMTDPHKTE